MADDGRARLVGINHIALEGGDVDAALAFYGRIFAFELRGQTTAKDGTLDMAFIDMGDQFIALSRGREQGPDRHRHFGLVVEDRSQVAALARAAGAEMVADVEPYERMKLRMLNGSHRGGGIPRHPVHQDGRGDGKAGRLSGQEREGAEGDCRKGALLIGVDP